MYVHVEIDTNQASGMLTYVVSLHAHKLHYAMYVHVRYANICMYMYIHVPCTYVHVLYIRTRMHILQENRLSPDGV